MTNKCLYMGYDHPKFHGEIKGNIKIHSHIYFGNAWYVLTTQIFTKVNTQLLFSLTWLAVFVCLSSLFLPVLVVVAIKKNLYI